MHSQCYKEDGSSKSPDCPVCSRSLNKLAQPLPMAHCANSRLVCKISGDVMNENNPPMMLPNGYVYGYNVRGWGRVLGWAALRRLPVELLGFPGSVSVPQEMVAG